MHKQSSLPEIEVNENCSADSINMIIGGMLPIISHVIKRDMTKDVLSQIDGEIKLCVILS